MADHKCYRCAYRSKAGPRDVRERVRCYPLMGDGGPPPFWMVDGRLKEGDLRQKRPYYYDLDGGEVRLSEDCLRFKEAQPPRAPVQGDLGIPKGEPGRQAGTVAWAEHAEAYRGYAGLYGTSYQTAEQVAERGGFGYRELAKYLGHAPETWEPRS